MTTTYERIKFELASRFNLNKYHNDTIVKINGHEKPPPLSVLSYKTHTSYLDLCLTAQLL